MRSPLRKELLVRFKTTMQARFPHFEYMSEDRGPWRWIWQATPNLTLFILLQALERDDKFVLEVAWSEDGTFPWGRIGRIKVDQPQGRDRLGSLWHQPGQAAPVWDIAPEMTIAMEEHRHSRVSGQSLPYPSDPPIEDVFLRVSPLVCDAVAKLEEYGIPLFRQVLEVRGASWPAL